MFGLRETNSLSCTQHRKGSIRLRVIMPLLGGLSGWGMPKIWNQRNFISGTTAQWKNGIAVRAENAELRKDCLGK